jgi:hypothetical protein
VAGIGRIMAKTYAIAWPGTIHWLDLEGLMQWINLGSMLLSQRDIIEIKRVLGMHVASEHAVPAIDAGLLGHAPMGIQARGTGVNADIH